MDVNWRTVERILCDYFRGASNAGNAAASFFATIEADHCVFEDCSCVNNGDLHEAAIDLTSLARFIAGELGGAS
jgi:hypothetical protein